MENSRQIKHSDAVHKRVGHITVSYRHFIVVWGGFMGEKEETVVPTEYCPTDQVWMYNCHTEVWSLSISQGKVPYKNSGSTGLVLDDYLYIFGGIEELTDDQWRYSSGLYRLNFLTMEWEKLSPTGTRPLGCDKGAGWVYANRLYYFGGYGQRPRQSSTKYKFVPDVGIEGSRGWNNQLWCYEPLLNRWSWPRTRGAPPEPRAAHSAHITDTTAYIFGGRLGHFRNNDLYVLDMLTMRWSNNLTLEHDGAVPDGRSWHSFNFIENNRAILYGGLNQEGNPSQSWWELRLDENTTDVSRFKWKEHQMREPLVWHKAATSLSTGELIIVGGVLQSPYAMSNSDHVNQLLVLQFQPLTLYRLCLKCIVKNMKLRDIEEISRALPAVLANVISARLYWKMT